MVSGNALGAYRTRLMEQAQADRFAAMLRSNAKFTGVSVAQSNRAKTAARYFVYFEASNEARRQELLRQHQAVQDERAVNEWQNYVVTATPTPTVFDVERQDTRESYQVYLHGDGFACQCDQHHFRTGRAGLACKHRGIVILHREFGLIQPAPAVIGRR